MRIGAVNCTVEKSETLQNMRMCLLAGYPSELIEYPLNEVSDDSSYHIKTLYRDCQRPTTSLSIRQTCGITGRRDSRKMKNVRQKVEHKSHAHEGSLSILVRGQ